MAFVMEMFPGYVISLRGDLGGHHIRQMWHPGIISLDLSLVQGVPKLTSILKRPSRKWELKKFKPSRLTWRVEKWTTADIGSTSALKVEPAVWVTYFFKTQLILRILKWHYDHNCVSWHSTWRGTWVWGGYMFLGNKNKTPYIRAALCIGLLM